MKAPAWLLPPVVVPDVRPRPRNVGEPDAAAKRKARYLRWRRSSKGRAWLEANKVRRNAYYRVRYHANPKRRDYLRMKQREYRLARMASA